MSKMDDAQKRAKKILEEVERQQAKAEQAKSASDQAGQSGTHVNVETHSEQTATAGEVTTDAETTVTAEAHGDVAELTADLQRLQAEFANYKRRTDAERAEAAAFMTARAAREFLAVRDSFDQEQAHRPADTDPKWAASIDAIRAQFDKSLANLGVERFVSVGQPFDPHLHEAISMDGGDEVVTEELAPGYKMGDTILRHAMVKVGPAPTE